MIEISNISFSFNKNSTLFNNLSFDINKGDRVYISGENGSGKTTLLKLIIGALKIENGNIKYIRDYKKIFTPTKLDNFLLSWYSIKQNFNFFQYKGENINSNTNAKKYIDLIRYFFPNINETFLEKRIYELSSGEKAVVSFISSQLTNSEIYFFDEIFANTSKNISDKIIDFIIKNKLTIIFTSHSKLIANKLCTKEIKIEK